MAMMDDKETSDVGGEMCILTDPAWATSVSTVTGMNLSCAFRHTFLCFHGIIMMLNACPCRSSYSKQLTSGKSQVISMRRQVAPST